MIDTVSIHDLNVAECRECGSPLPQMKNIFIQSLVVDELCQQCVEETLTCEGRAWNG